MAWRDWKIVQFFLRPKSHVDEAAPQQVVQEATGPADRQKGIIKKIGLAFVGGSGGKGRLTYEDPAGFNFLDIEKAYLTDSYIRQAIDKYVDFMFKAGWDIVGKNPKAVEYIKLRLAAMAVGTDKPLGEFFLDVAEDLIKYHNVFIIKARAGNTYQYPPGITAKPVLSTKTVAGYYVLPTSTIQIARDPNGTVKKYKQAISGSASAKPIEVNPEDIIHIAVDKPQGRAFGFPFLWQVLDDVKILRQLEELTDRMVYKNLFPLMVYKVGLDKEGFQATNDEIEEVRAMLGELALDGGIVLPERHNIESVTTSPMDVVPILEFFKKRVFSGLGVSATIMGEGDTANKSTSDNLDQMFKDRIKSYQKIMAEYITSRVFYEILLEGGFDPLIKPEDEVRFVFKEIDLQAKMAAQNHVVQLFTQNAITHEEMRTELGYEAATPEEENRLSFKMIQAYLAQVAADARAAASTTAADNAGANKNQPANQHGTRPAAKTTKNSLGESLIGKNKCDDMNKALNRYYEAARSDVIRCMREYIQKGKPLNEFTGREIEGPLKVIIDSMAGQSKKFVGQAFIEGAEKAKREAGKTVVGINYTAGINMAKQACAENIDKIMEDVCKQLLKTIQSSTPENYVYDITGVFVAMQYRLRFLATTQINSSYNIGFAKAARELGYETAYIESTCEECLRLVGDEINLFSSEIPPFHPNCSCRMTLLKKEGGK